MHYAVMTIPTSRLGHGPRGNDRVEAVCIVSNHTSRGPIQVRRGVSGFTRSSIRIESRS